MSVEDFEAAIAVNSGTRVALVSERLFFALDTVGKVEMKQISKALPLLPKNGGPVLSKLRELVEKTGGPLTLTIFVLSALPTISLDLAFLHSVPLDEWGTNSFLLL